MTSTSALPGTTILNLPIATALDGSEWSPIVQGGTTKRGQTGDISNIFSQTVPIVITSSAPPGYPAARRLSGQTGAISITDGGGSSNVTVGLQGGFLTTPFGGTGVTSFEPYQVVLGGTSSAGALQQVTAGTSGYTLTYVSSTAAPTWQAAPGFTQATAGNIAVYTSTNAVGGSAYVNASSGSVTLGLASSATGKLLLASSAGGTTTLQPSSLSPTLTGPLTTTTLIGKDTVDTLTGKSFDTAGSSNSFRINGTAITAVTGAGSVVLGSTPSISSAAITGGQINTISSFGLRTTGAAFDLIIGSTEALTASRNLFVRIGNANRNLVLNGDFTIASSFPVSVTSTAASSLSIPVTGTLATLAGAETLTNKTFDTNLNTFKVAGTPVVTAPNILDTITSSQGALVYRTSATWAGLTIGSSTQVLLGGSVPQWGSLSGTGTVTGIAFSAPLTGGTITSTGNVSLNATIFPQGRLTLATGTPVMTATVTGSSRIFYTPYLGNLASIYDGTTMVPSSFAELSQNSTDTSKSPSAAAAGTLYDMLLWNDSGTMRCTRASSWATTAARASSGALSRINGVLVNDSAVTNGPSSGKGVYVGTVYASTGSALFDYILGGSASGGTAGFLGVWNMYNRVNANAVVVDSGAQYTYTSNTHRQARASAGNQVSLVIGQQEDAVTVSYSGRLDTVAATPASGRWGVGLDTTTAFSNYIEFIAYSPTATGSIGAGTASGILSVGVGLHVVAAVERGDAVNANIFDGEASNTLMVQVRL